MINVKKILLIIADSSRALFYIAHGSHNIVKLDEINDPEGRFKDSELSSKEHDVNTYPYEMKNSKKAHEKLHFSKLVVAQINKILETEHLDEICIFSPTKFMGLINKGRLKKHIKITEVTKEITHLHANDLQKLIEEAGLNFMPS